MTVEAANGEITIEKKPERIVSLSAAHTETLFAIGAQPPGDRRRRPVELPARGPPRTDLSGFKPNVEAIVAQKPDLVVVSDDMDQVIAGLAKLNVPVLWEPSAKTLDEAYDEITDLGAATGNLEKAEEVVTTMRTTLDQLAADAPPRARA
ncbi:ABC transporter substrate-binding protein [Nonomuraea ferruginea]